MNYFDHAASAPIYPEVLDVLTKTLREDFANPSSQHILGQTLQEKIEEYREGFLKELGLQGKGHFIFTSSATESNNTIIKGLLLKEGDACLYCKADHPSVTEPIQDLAERFNIELREIVLLPEGSIDQEKFFASLDKKVKLIVLTHINNQSGEMIPLAPFLKNIKEKSSAHIHIDAVQSFGKIDLGMASADSISLTSHKIGGPKGIAGLFLKNDHKVRPLLLGGGQEKGFRSSTVAFPLIVGFHEAMKISVRQKEKSLIEITAFHSRIQKKLSAAIPTIQWPFKNPSPYILSFIVPGIPSDIILRHLEVRNIFISSTSACSSRIAGFNPSLFAMSIPERYHKNFLRISLGQRTKIEEVDELIEEFISMWDNIKHMQKR